MDKSRQLQTIGWREWVSLPEVRIPAIKAKIDTGARTSALHAFHLDEFDQDGEPFVRFKIHPMQRSFDIELQCTARIVDERIVRDSGGHAEKRYVIRTPFCFGGGCWPIEITLTSREDMLFKMLIGRSAIVAAAICVDPGRSFTLGRTLARAYAKPVMQGVND